MDLPTPVDILHLTEMILITLFLCDSTAVYGQHFIFATLDYVLHGLQIERGGGGVGRGGGGQHIFYFSQKERFQVCQVSLMTALWTVVFFMTMDGQ